MCPQTSLSWIYKQEKWWGRKKKMTLQPPSAEYILLTFLRGGNWQLQPFHIAKLVLLELWLEGTLRADKKKKKFQQLHLVKKLVLHHAGGEERDRESPFTSQKNEKCRICWEGSLQIAAYLPLGKEIAKVTAKASPLPVRVSEHQWEHWWRLKGSTGGTVLQNYLCVMKAFKGGDGAYQCPTSCGPFYHDC